MNLFMDTAEVTMTRDIIPNYALALFLFGVLSLLVAFIFRSVYPQNGCVAYSLIGMLFLFIYLWNSLTVTGLVDRECATKYAVFYLNQ